MVKDAVERRPARRLKGVRLAAIILVGVTVAATVGYMTIEGWTAWEAFYMTVITITTVGYREVHPMSRAGELFTVILLIVGVSSALYTFTLMATAVIEGGLPAHLQWRRRARMIEKLTNHFIVCGYGRIGSTAARTLAREHAPLVVIEQDATRVQAAIDDGMLAVQADASREETLRTVHIERARGLIAAVGSDAANVYTVLTAHVMRPDLPVVARADTEDAVDKLKRAGASRVVSPYLIGGVQIAQTALRPAVVDFFELATSADHLELAIEEIPVSSHSPLAGQSVLEANLRQRYGVIVVAIQRKDQTMEFNPDPEMAIRAGDKLVVLGPPASLKRLEVEALS